MAICPLLMHNIDYTFLSKSIEDLQQAGATLCQTLQILDNVEEKINLVGEDVGLRIKEKFVSIIQKKRIWIK